MKKIKGSIVNLSSIYGVVAQDTSVYKTTKMSENISYAPIKSGIIVLQNYLLRIMLNMG